MNSKCNANTVRNRFYGILLVVLVALLAGIATRMNTYAAPDDAKKDTVNKDKVAVQQKMRVAEPKQNAPKPGNRVDNKPPEPAMTPNPNLPGTVAGDPYYDLLILGIDRRPHQKTGRSDVILIVHCEPNHISFFSIPRDTLTQGRGG